MTNVAWESPIKLIIPFLNSSPFDEASRCFWSVCVKVGSREGGGSPAKPCLSEPSIVGAKTASIEANKEDKSNSGVNGFTDMI